MPELLTLFLDDHQCTLYLLDLAGPESENLQWQFEQNPEQANAAEDKEEGGGKRQPQYGNADQIARAS